MARIFASCQVRCPEEPRRQVLRQAQARCRQGAFGLRQGGAIKAFQSILQSPDLLQDQIDRKMDANPQAGTDRGLNARSIPLEATHFRDEIAQVSGLMHNNRRSKIDCVEYMHKMARRRGWNSQKSLAEWNKLSNDPKVERDYLGGSWQ